MRARTKWAAVLVAVSAVLMGALVVYGVATHTEAGLLRACSRGDLSLDYAGDCADVLWDVERVSWPLRTRVHGASDWQRVLFAGAAAGLEHEAGLDMFILVGDAAPADVVVDFAVPHEVGHWSPSGRVRHLVSPDTGRVTTCFMYLSNLALSETVDMVVRHELGHVMGLAHDRDAASLMTGRSLDPVRHYALSRDDRLLLQRHYAKQ